MSEKHFCSEGNPYTCDSCINAAAANAVWGSVGAEIPAVHYQIYLKEGVVQKDLLVCATCENTACECTPEVNAEGDTDAGVVEG